MAFVDLSIICFALAGEVAAGDITTGRARALATVAVALISLVLGALAMARFASLIGFGNGRLMAIGALVLGIIGIVASGLHLAGSTGFGTGGGRLGSIVALLLAASGTLLGGITFFRARRIAHHIGES